MINTEIFEQASALVELLKLNNLKIATAESCTGGMASAYITSVSGVSQVFELGITSYSNNIKNKVLGVDSQTLREYGAISEAVAKQMAENVRKISGADIGASVTGAAGPAGSEGHSAGFVFIALSDGEVTQVKQLSIEPESRNYVREKTVIALFKFIINYIKEKH